jgi:molybdenum cofactor cytidylyltransferase
MAEAEAADCIVPAAGQSARMGAWKPVLSFGSSTIVQTVVAAALGACARVILVTGHRGSELAALFRTEPRILIVENPDWLLGMFSSIQRGLAHVATPRFFISLGDMPWVGTAVYQALLSAAPAPAVFPVFGGFRGHPVLFDAAIRDAALRADPETGSMKEIASGFASIEVPWEDDAILRDIDRMEDRP